MSKKGTNTAFVDRVEDGIAIITLDHYPVNSLSTHVWNGITKSIQDLERRGDIKGVVVRGAGRCFCAGADISGFGSDKTPRLELGRPSSDPFGLENLPFPVVAAIHTFALGGGLELALSCHYRVIAEKSVIGFPEVNIGLLPGAQGTQRLPRLIGADNALKLMTDGRHVPAKQAHAWGVVDAIVPHGEDLLSAAIAFCKDKAAAGEMRRICDIPAPPPTNFAKWQQEMAKKRRGEPAGPAIVKCVEAACKGTNFADGVALERELFGQLVTSPESRGLRHMFFSERAGVKVKGLKARPKKVMSIGIVGAGLMGGGIAMCCANIGMSVVLLDVSQKGLERGMKLVEKNYTRSVKRGSKSQAFVDKALGLIKPTTQYTDLSQVDMVVEAVFEDMDLKKKIFKQLDQVCKADAFLCTNTSRLDIDEIASVTKRPELVMGTHFFSPANVMKLLENVRGAKTNDLTIATMMDWGKRIKKWCILVGNCNGFVGNRMVSFYSGAAQSLLLEGATPLQVDRAALQFGMRMGPIAMVDLVGIDLGIQAVKKAGKYDPLHNAHHALIEMGRLGLKSQAGFFDYEGRRSKDSPVVMEMLQQIAKRNGVAPKQHSDEEICQRLFVPMINEAFDILAEGMAEKPSDIDVCYVHGYSFPRYRGGPMLYADEIGLPNVIKILQGLNIKPAALLATVAASGQSLSKYWAKNGANVLRAARSKPTSKL